MLRTAAVVLLAVCATACSSQDPVSTGIEVVSVDPRFLPASATEVSILFRVTRTGAVRVEGDIEQADPVVARVDEVAAGGLASVRVPLAGFEPGSHLVTLVLSPTNGGPPADTQASFTIAEAPPPDEDGGVPPPDGGGPTCVQSCAGQGDGPVCGSDGVTYDSQCLLECAGVGKLFDGDCNDPTQDCVERCMNEGFEMVCGVDGQTYLNQCHIDCEDVSVAHIGPCFGF